MTLRSSTNTFDTNSIVGDEDYSKHGSLPSLGSIMSTLRNIDVVAFMPLVLYANSNNAPEDFSASPYLHKDYEDEESVFSLSDEETRILSFFDAKNNMEYSYSRILPFAIFNNAFEYLLARKKSTTRSPWYDKFTKDGARFINRDHVSSKPETTMLDLIKLPQVRSQRPPVYLKALERLVKRGGFDYKMCDPIRVVFFKRKNFKTNKEETVFLIVDGQHRIIKMCLVAIHAANYDRIGALEILSSMKAPINIIQVGSEDEACRDFQDMQLFRTVVPKSVIHANEYNLGNPLALVTIAWMRENGICSRRTLPKMGEVNTPKFYLDTDACACLLFFEYLKRTEKVLNYESKNLGLEKLKNVLEKGLKTQTPQELLHKVIRPSLLDLTFDMVKKAYSTKITTAVQQLEKFPIASLMSFISYNFSRDVLEASATKKKNRSTTWLTEEQKNCLAGTLLSLINMNEELSMRIIGGTKGKRAVVTIGQIAEYCNNSAQANLFHPRTYSSYKRDALKKRETSILEVETSDSFKELSAYFSSSGFLPSTY